eukprot:1155546-Pelagomonas_calceolata.AAC.5
MLSATMHAPTAPQVGGLCAERSGGGGRNAASRVYVVHTQPAAARCALYKAEKDCLLGCAERATWMWCTLRLQRPRVSQAVRPYPAGTDSLQHRVHGNSGWRENGGGQGVGEWRGLFLVLRRES